MSRSYKKTPIIKDNDKSKKIAKKLANKRVRNKLKNQDYDIADGNAYQKEYNSWNIVDYSHRWTREEAIAQYKQYTSVEYYTCNYLATPGFEERMVEEFLSKYPTLESWLNYWEKCAVRK